MHEYRAVVRHVIDGGTVDCMIDYGFYHSHDMVQLRIVGPEGKVLDVCKPDRGIEDEQQMGRLAKQLVEQLLPVGKEVVIRTYKPSAAGNPVRWHACIYHDADIQSDVATRVVDAGLGTWEAQ